MARLGAALLLAMTCAPALAGKPEGQGSAVVLMYHRVGEEQRFETAISVAQFEAHLSELTSGRYRVLPLTEIVGRLAEGPRLPERTLGLSFDDAFLSSYRTAWPRLRAAGLPVTLFIATDHIDQGLAAYMGWPELRALAASGLVEIGLQGSAHGHLATQPLAAARDDIERAMARFTAELGRPPRLFSYPYGEYGLALRDLVAELGFEAAFGQQSGAFEASDDRFALPRFAISRRHGGLERLRLMAGALPLPAADLSPRDPLLAAGENPPRFGFTLTAGAASGPAVTCYADGRPVAVTLTGGSRLTVVLEEPFAAGRHRINCTQPGPEGRWRWRGALFTLPRASEEGTD